MIDVAIYTQLGARAILRRALHEIGIEVKATIHTDTLLHLARAEDAPVEKIAGWWELIAEGKPRISNVQRSLMRAAAARAVEMFRAADA